MEPEPFPGNDWLEEPDSGQDRAGRQSTWLKIKNKDYSRHQAIRAATLSVSHPDEP